MEKSKTGGKLIKFGTDGWRGIIADDFTVEKIKMVTSGVCKYLKLKTGGRKKCPTVVVGYDTRFMSDRFAKTVSSTLAANNVKTYISSNFIPTPALSVAVVKRSADLGIMITASHNPYYYNGYKIKGSYGGSATPDIVAEIEDSVNQYIKGSSCPSCYADSNFNYDKNIIVEDFTTGYRKHVLSLVDLDAVKNFNFKVLIDPMYGAAQNLYRDMLEAISPGKIIEIHSVLNPAFGGINPEPIGDNLNDAVSAIKKEKCALCICLDGDGDRVAALGEDGNFISSHHIFAVLLNHIVKNKKPAGKVVKTVSTSSVIDKICSKYGLELVTTPIGFKYISDEILKGGVVIGGEESGGLWEEGNIPERDGIFIGLKLIETMCKEGRTINNILEEIYNDFGYFVYRRLDYEISAVQKEKLKEMLSKRVPDILQTEGTREVVTIDGYKYVMDDGSWVMIRPSGTEAVVRIYAESDSEKKLNRLHNLGKKVVDSVMQKG